MANKQRNVKLETQWRSTLRKHAKSRLSVRQFCRREQIREPSFYYWRRIIAQRDSQAKSKPTVRRRSKRKAAGQQAFVPVVLNANDAEGQHTSIVIELRGQRTLRVPESIEPTHLARIVHAIEAQPQS